MAGERRGRREKIWKRENDWLEKEREIQVRSGERKRGRGFVGKSPYYSSQVDMAKNADWCANWHVEDFNGKVETY